MIQHAWREHAAANKVPLVVMRNCVTRQKCSVQRLIIAYSRQSTQLGNLITNRMIEDYPGAPSSSYYNLDKRHEGPVETVAAKGYPASTLKVLCVSFSATACY